MLRCSNKHHPSRAFTSNEQHMHLSLMTEYRRPPTGDTDPICVHLDIKNYAGMARSLYGTLSAQPLHSSFTYLSRMSFHCFCSSWKANQRHITPVPNTKKSGTHSLVPPIPERCDSDVECNAKPEPGSKDGGHVNTW